MSLIGKPTKQISDAEVAKQLGKDNALYLDQLIQETLESRKGVNLFSEENYVDEAMRGSGNYLFDRINHAESMGIPGTIKTPDGKTIINPFVTQLDGLTGLTGKGSQYPQELRVGDSTLR